MQVSNCFHKCTYRAHILVLRVTKFSSTVENSIEFANLICVSNVFEELLNFRSWSHNLEISLCDAQFLESLWEKNINGFWLITIVLIISHRFLHFQWDISTNTWASKRTVNIFRLSNFV